MPVEKNKVVDAVYDYILKNGPILPVDVSKIVGDTLLAGAVLSGLRERNLIKISHAKIGSSPVYYVEGQEPKLEMLYGYLSSIQKKAYDLIKSKKVIRERDLEPAMRVAIKMIKDFAYPLNVRTKESSEIFWKWYLLSDRETNELISQILDKSQPQSISKITQEEPKQEKVIEEEVKRIDSSEIEMLKKEIEMLKQQIQSKTKKEKVTKDKKLEDFAEAPALEVEMKKDAFLAEVINFCKKNRIEIIDWKIKKRNSEIDMTVRMSSPVGQAEYFCRAKNKKKINEGDLSTTFIHAQNMKLPAILLSTGDLSKKAESVLSTELKGMLFKRI